MTERFIGVVISFANEYLEENERDSVLNQLHDNIIPHEDWGIDSLDLTHMLMCLEDEYDIEISDETAVKLKTIKEICDYCEQFN